MGGSTFDVSGMGNHGVPADVQPGTGADAGSYTFASAASGIMVAPSLSLQNLQALRVRMKIRADPWDGARRNLVEGFVSFAFTLGGDGTLTGTIVDRSGAWSGVSAAGAVTPGRWHEVEMVHDGVGTVALKVDGHVVAVRTDVPGPVRSVGPLGVAIGRWPDANRYAFKGGIGELQIWRFDPVKAVTKYLSCCCHRDTAPLEAVLAELRERGVDGAQAAELARQAQQATLDLLQAVHGPEAKGNTELERSLDLFQRALAGRDRRRLSPLRRRARDLLQADANAGALTGWRQRMEDIARQIGLSRREQEAMLHALCLDVVPPDDPHRPRPDPSPAVEGGPWDHVPTPEPLIPADRRVG
ncbi:LamG domain-containing protein [Microbispora hainanensis]|uniref:LamG domain-containing protein n=1 Tax=Microbispora hainanensis TaxID=568844 RepID=UPI00324337A9